MVSSQQKYRFHIPGYVHLPVSERYMACAFTQKVVKLSKMILSLGHEVFLYGAESSDTPCTQFFQTHTLSDIRKEWGEGDNRFDIGYDFKKKGFKHDFNKNKTPTTLRFYDVVSEQINKIKKPDDFLLIMQGAYHRPIHDNTQLFLTCEPGIGYRGSYSRFRAFESSYLQNFTYGSENPRLSINGNYYDRVIPNYFDLKDFKFSDKKEDYFLYMGRLIIRKGVETAHEVCKYLGVDLKLAGQGAVYWNAADRVLKTEEFTIRGNHLNYVGFADIKMRKELFAKARAVFVPTIYLEAFGGVNVEAQLSGTPVITTNFGCFLETVEQGKTGFRCNTLQDFVDAAKQVDKLDYKYIRDRAVRKYAMGNVKMQYQKWFSDLYQLYLSATIPNTKGWHYLTDSDISK